MTRKYVQLVKIEIDGILVNAKECTNCGVVKSLDRYNAKKNGLGKKASRCKECDLEYRKQRAHIKAEYDKQYREENSARIKQYRKEWYEENREADIARRKRQYYANHESELAARRKYYKENKEILNEYSRHYYKENKEKIIEYRENNKEKILDYGRRRYQENKEKFAEWWQEYYQKNKEHLNKKSRKRYFDNRDRMREINKQWFKDNPEQAQVIRMRRRTREYLLPDDITYEEVEEIKLFFGGCALTGETENIHLDHVIPLATGRIEAIYGNIIPLKGSLNESKRDKNIFEWFKQNKEHWNLSQEKFNKLIEYLAKQNEMSVDEYKGYVYWCHENPVQMDIDVENGIVQLSLL
ncbi:hypothetical protein ACS2Q8_25955 [Bacillus cereus group sp. Bce007]|uniref:hypothetical protein n=1 Tax=Bacillus cereus group sp. Bce007 TaxID=3445254 RepID=UPI003F1FDCB0